MFRNGARGFGRVSGTLATRKDATSSSSTAMRRVAPNGCLASRPSWPPGRAVRYKGDGAGADDGGETAVMATPQGCAKRPQGTEEPLQRPQPAPPAVGEQAS